MTVFGSAVRVVVMRLAVMVGLAVAMSSFLAPQASAQVTSERLLNSSKEPQNWLMYSGNYAGHRFSALDQINTSNAASLVPKWAYQTMAGGKFETTPLVVDGVLYGTGQEDRVFALDAAIRAAHLAVSAGASGRYQTLLRASEPRDRHSRRQGFCCDAGRARPCSRRQDRRRGLGRGVCNHAKGTASR